MPILWPLNRFLIKMALLSSRTSDDPSSNLQVPLNNWCTFCISFTGVSASITRPPLSSNTLCLRKKSTMSYIVSSTGDMQHMLLYVGYEACLLLCVVDGILVHLVHYVHLAIAVVIDPASVYNLLLFVYIVISKPVEVSVSTKRVIGDGIYLVVHLRVALRCRGSGHEDDVGSTLTDEVSHLLSTTTRLRTCSHGVRLVYDDKVPFNFWYLVQGLVVYGEQNEGRTQHLHVLGD